MLLLSYAGFFLCVKVDFFSKLISDTLSRVSNSLDPDQDRRCVGPDLGPNCLQKLSKND